MKRTSLLYLLFMGVLACGAIMPALALAKPSITLLPGETFPVKFVSTSGLGTLETVSGKSLACSEENASGEIENSTLGNATDDLKGCKEGKLPCRSENAKGEKDPVETVLVQNIKGGLIAVLNSAKELKAGVFNILTGTLKVTCGTLKIEVKGSTIGLVTPINKEISTTEHASLISKQKSGKPESGSCIEEKALCEKLVAEPLEINLNGKFEQAATELTGTITFAKMLSISV